MNNNIKERIAKLLALAESPNENEAKAALLKARALMVQHKFRPEECTGKKRKGRDQGPCRYQVHDNDRLLDLQAERRDCQALLLQELLPQAAAQQGTHDYFDGS